MEPGMLGSALRYASITTQFALTLGVLGYLGYRADERFGCEPWGVLIGILTGMGLGLFALLKQIEKLEKSESSKRSRGK